MPSSAPRRPSWPLADSFTGAALITYLFPITLLAILVFIAVTTFIAAIGNDHERSRGPDFEANLSGVQEVPARDTPATGEVEVEFDEAFTQAEVRLEVSNIQNVVAAHFHCNRAGLNGPVAFGLFSPGDFVFDAESGVAEGVLTNDDFTGADCEPIIDRPVNNIAALAFAMQDGLIYANVHTDDGEGDPNTGPGDFPDGEIRGQFWED
jgi:hypothetical protein